MNPGLFFIVIVLTWILYATTIKAITEQVLIVIGDVTENSARILYDALDRDLVGGSLTADLFDDKNEAIFQEVLVVGEGPRIWQISGLVPGKSYRIQLQTYKSEKSFGRFRTWSDHDPHIRILAASCNNFLDDNDDSFLAELLDDALVQSRFGMVHLGDQLYADFIYHEWTKTGRLASQNDLVEQYRNAYRKIWSKSSMRMLLSTGANWMVIDDHDILNNLDHDQLQDGREPLLRAGRQVFLEYQLQLQFNIFDEYDQEIGRPQCYYTKKIGSLAFVFVDTRLERTFNYDSSAPFLGTSQMKSISLWLSKLSQDPDISKIVVITSVPLMWAPATWVSLLPDIAEREKMALHPAHRNETLKLITMASQHSTKVMLLSGDIHFFLHGEICSKSDSGNLCIDQITTSGLTLASTAANSMKLLAFHFLALAIGSNHADNWFFIPKNINLGHNAALFDMSYHKFSCTPIFVRSPSLWLETIQFLFTSACFLSYYFKLFIVFLTCILLLYACRRRIKPKTKIN